MSLKVLVSLMAGALLAGASARQPAATASLPAQTTAAHEDPLVGEYCTSCHTEKKPTGGLTLVGFDSSTAEKRAEVAEKMIRKLRTGMMPPPGSPRPDPAVIAAFVTGLETRIDAAAAANPNPGWRPFQRRPREEYAGVVRDLFGLDVDAAEFLPADTVSAGFDNVADVQTFSPTLMTGYLRGAS